MPVVEPAVSKEELEKIEYVKKVESMMSQKYKESMMSLLEMGYVNFAENEKLVKQFSGEVDQIINHLLGM